MITEIAQIDIKPGTERDFEAAIAKTKPLFLRAAGCLGFELHRSIEKSQRYRMIVRWKTLENHTVDFVNSRDFAELVALIGPYIAAQPNIEHTEIMLAVTVQ